MKTSSADKFKILIVAAEASSSLYAERLLEQWNQQKIPFDAFGIGSLKMESLGFKRVGKAEELAVVGLQEVISNFSKIYKVFHDLVELSKIEKPDIVLLMDYPDFNFRLAKKLKKLGFKVVYYISPQVWAWRTGRVHFIKKYIDKMLVLFPFEVDFYKKYNIDVQFVGHPLLDELKNELFEKKFQGDLRNRYGIKDDKFVLGLMPGSRKSELKHHLLIQLETAKILYQKNKNLVVTLLVAPTLTTEYVKSLIPSDMDIPLILVRKDPFEMVALTDFVLVASGTATLTVGLMEKPMAIMYKMNPLTVKLAQFIMKRPKYFGMANLILDKMVAKEFFQDEANPELMSAYIQEHINNPEKIKMQVSGWKELKLGLGNKGATQRVSEQILKEVQR